MQGVILSRDNLAKINWSGNQKRCFCDQSETIKHLFFDCQHARTVWRIEVENEMRFLIGGTALLWVIWCTRNDIVFEKKRYTFFMWAIFRGAYWLRCKRDRSLSKQGNRSCCSRYFCEEQMEKQ
ncbi:hypothetical protein U9M48_042341 [Paspalum notatum var. saurae]|uniref:Reverse transcriptase zinc-binding domain-containing protein n=1 Tax=Paspalum notatum var. saurae TaxID=547442 RepID=A0AAQ3UUW9_PASNO